MKQDYFYLDYDDTICERGETLYRIVYTKDLHDFLQTVEYKLDVAAGDLGGYISGYENIDQDTDYETYIDPASKIFSNTRISGSVILESEISDDCRINNCFITGSKLSRAFYDGSAIYDSNIRNISSVNATIDNLTKEYADEDDIVVGRMHLGGYYTDENGNKINYKNREFEILPSKDLGHLFLPVVTILSILFIIYVIIDA